MKKKTNIRAAIRKIVREEVAMAIDEVINELKQPSLSSEQVSQPQPKKKIVWPLHSNGVATSCDNTPKNVVISEYVKASEFFLEKSQISYLNAILDKLSKLIRKE